MVKNQMLAEQMRFNNQEELEGDVHDSRYLDGLCDIAGEEVSSAVRCDGAHAYGPSELPEPGSL